MPRNILKSSLYDAGFSIIFQILCRIVTFGINAFIIRHVGREVLGIMNVRLLLLESTVLFLSREAVSRAALSATSQQREKCTWSQLINQQWLTVIICIFVCLPCCYVWLNCLSSVDIVYLDQYRFACYAVLLSCIIELCAEPPVFVSQVFCFVKLKIGLNTLHIFVRSVIFLTIALTDPTAAIYAFAIAQLASAVTIVLSHYGFYAYYINSLNLYKQNRNPTSSCFLKSDLEDWRKYFFENMDDFPLKKLSEFLPGVMENESKFFNSELQILTLSFLKQAVLKQILTEGEKYVMSMSPVLNFEQQAMYDVVNNLGSLAARFIFRPIEDSSYFYFTQTISRDVPLNDQDKTKVQEAGIVLGHLSMTVISIGLLALCFGQSYSHTLLYLYGGADFIAGGLPEILLKWHCLAICFLAINGITEGYMFATNTSHDIDKYNYLLAVFSISFLLLSYVLTTIFGPVGFIFANCINMFCRICYSARFIWVQYKPLGINPLRDFVPSKMFLFAVFVGGFLCNSAMFKISMTSHLMLGFGCVFIVLMTWAYENKDLLKVCWAYRKKLKFE
uniref:Protein RFT1 homolog n=1 Tax=Glossina morsitans morsitans TaxID=37546 RepID=A0A1B0G5L4_GLOMM